ncbi:hypothetical protein GCM10023333_17430 [Ferrimonas pelagia]|uniref:Uncharacterized protein n=1 Tax=Ferrimonas pelagia TaxID=1177826 RepID=A0ABP9EPI3_9GAMM
MLVPELYSSPLVALATAGQGAPPPNNPVYLPSSLRSSKSAEQSRVARILACLSFVIVRSQPTRLEIALF